MAQRHNLIPPRADTASRAHWTRRRGPILAMVMLAVIVLAWFDGGEEPLHPISQDITVPEGR